VQHYDVLIATPGAMLEAQYVKSLVETLAECNRRGVSYKWLNAYASLVHHARELTASGGEGMQLDPDHRGPMGDSVTYNKIFWIDSDIAWTPEQFFKLYDSEYEVVSGAYIVSDEVTTTVHAWGKPGGIPIPEIMKMKAPLKVQSIGFGFVTMKYGVFERLPRPWFKHFDQTVPTAKGNQVVDSIGEDVSWCIKAYQAGIEIYFDPSVLVNHMKKRAITWPKK
jgi:hypothetical protein